MILCGVCVLFLALLTLNGALQKAQMFLVAACVMAVAGYYSWKESFRDLMDEVDDCGDYRLVKKRGNEDTVPFSNNINVKFLTLRRGEQPGFI